MPADLRAGLHADLQTLSQTALTLFDQADIYTTRAWYSAAEQACPPGARAVFLTLCLEEKPLAVFPLCQGPGNQLHALTTPYTGQWEPLVARGLCTQMQKRVASGFLRLCRRYGLTRLDALDPDFPLWAQVKNQALTFGLIPLAFDHFGNWQEILAPGADWKTYLAARPGALREAIRRKSSRLFKIDGAVFESVSTVIDLTRALAAYEKVYAASWKPVEPFPDFIPRFASSAAAQSSLRLTLLHCRGEPVAAQLWTVWRGVATVMKLAHRKDLDALSPGTVLTARSIQHFFATERLVGIDFGRGDDQYKALWTNTRWQRTGLVLANLASARGLVTAMAHGGGKLRRLVLRQS